MPARADKADVLRGASLLTRFQALARGVLDLRDLLYFASLIAAGLAATVLAVELKKAG